MLSLTMRQKREDGEGKLWSCMKVVEGLEWRIYIIRVRMVDLDLTMFKSESEALLVTSR